MGSKEGPTAVSQQYQPNCDFEVDSINTLLGHMGIIPRQKENF
jgi:hypothetical protein